LADDELLSLIEDSFASSFKFVFEILADCNYTSYFL